MIQLIFTGFIFLALCDPLIRKSEDSFYKRIWLKIFKKPILEQIKNFQNSIMIKLEDKYGKNPNTNSINYEEAMDDISKKYGKTIIIIGLLLILTGIIGLIISFFM
jgi:hypothetical protein